MPQFGNYPEILSWVSWSEVLQFGNLNLGPFFRGLGLGVGDKDVRGAFYENHEFGFAFGFCRVLHSVRTKDKRQGLKHVALLGSWL
jgi:hypothetical protein